jgi:hypothetical protein
MVLVDQAAEQFPPLYLGHDLHRLDVALPIQCPKVDAAVGSRGVVVTSVARKDAVQMTATDATTGAAQRANRNKRTLQGSPCRAGGATLSFAE